MSSVDCDQCLSEIRAEERNEKTKKKNVTASVTCEWRAAKPQAASSAGGRRLHISRLHAHDPPFACVAFFPTDFLAKERLLVVYVLKQEVCL